MNLLTGLAKIDIDPGQVNTQVCHDMPLEIQRVATRAGLIALVAILVRLCAPGAVTWERLKWLLL